jgi:hypothetical protein
MVAMRIVAAGARFSIVQAEEVENLMITSEQRLVAIASDVI